MNDNIAPFRIGNVEYAPAGFIDVTHWNGHRLPLRIEFNEDQFGIWYDLIDAGHRILDIPGDFERLLEIVDEANASIAQRDVGGCLRRGRELTVVRRLVRTHPCEGLQAHLGLAFECIMNSYRTQWIDRATYDELRYRGIIDKWNLANGEMIDRWVAWRAAENAELRKRKMLWF